MSAVFARTAAFLLVTALAACGAGSVTEDVGTLWGGESAAEREARQAEQSRRNNKVPMQSIASLEIGRTPDGILITAIGTAPGLGFSLPTLRVRRDGRTGPDGVIEFDFVASQPAPGRTLPPGNSRTRQIRADLPVSARDLQGVAGIRVLTLTGSSEVRF